MRQWEPLPAGSFLIYRQAMGNRYETDILRILTEAGPQGMPLRKLVLHVYNQNASLFGSPDYDEVYRHVCQFLRRHSQTPRSLVEHMDEWGRYRLNLSRSPQAQQLMLQFTEEQDEEPELPKREEIPSPSLFD